MSAVKKVEEFEAVGFVPVKRPDIPPYPMSKPFDWRVDPYDDSNWCFQLQTLRYLMIYQSAYRETGNEGYLLSLIDWFGDWWSSAKSSPGSYTWHDMATGIRSEKIHQLAKEIKASGLKKPVWFDEMIQAHVRVLRKKGFIRLNHNHGLYAVHGLRCLAEHIGPGMRRNVLSYAKACFEEIIKNQFDKNYVHKEHSPHYHHLVLKSLKEYKKTGLYNSLSVLDEYIDGAEEVAPNLYLPDGREIPFGDTDNQEPPRGIPPTDSSKESLWCKSGYAVYKNLGSYLCMTNSYNNNIHKHWDNLSFIFGEGGQDIFVDPGKYKYTKDEVREKILSADAHSTINLDGFCWSGGDIIKESMGLEGALINKKLMLRGSLSVKGSGGIFHFDRRLEYQPGYLEITDKVTVSEVISESGDLPLAYSRIVFHKDAKIKQRKKKEIFLDINDVDVSVEVEAVSGTGLMLDDLYLIESTPVSYSYGEYFESLSLRIYNPGVLRISVYVK